MPWIVSEEIIPPEDQEVYIWKDGKCVKTKLTEKELYDGRGKINPDIPKFWAYKEQKESPISKDPELHEENVRAQEDNVRPRL